MRLQLEPCCKLMRYPHTARFSSSAHLSSRSSQFFTCNPLACGKPAPPLLISSLKAIIIAFKCQVHVFHEPDFPGLPGFPLGANSNSKKQRRSDPHATPWIGSHDDPSCQPMPQDTLQGCQASKRQAQLAALKHGLHGNGTAPRSLGRELGCEICEARPKVFNF